MARTTRSKTSIPGAKPITPRSARAKTGTPGASDEGVAAAERSNLSPAVSDTSDTGMAPSGPEMKKQELVQKVVTRSGIKKKDAKPVVEAMLEVLGEALAEGRELNLQPFGKVKLNRTKEMARARVIVAKIRQSKNDGVAKETVAAAAE